MTKKYYSKLQKFVLKTVWSWEHRNVVPFPEKQGDRKKVNNQLLSEFFGVSKGAISPSMRVSLSQSQKNLRQAGLIQHSCYGIKLTPAGRSMANALSDPTLERILSIKRIKWPEGWTVQRPDLDQLSVEQSTELVIYHHEKPIGKLILFTNSSGNDEG